jgi:hypothetical protein
MKTLLLLLIGLGLAVPAMAQQQHYELRPFTCPPQQWVYGFNPATHGYPGWFCRVVHPPLGGANGTFTCITNITVFNGIVAAATPGSC